MHSLSLPAALRPSLFLTLLYLLTPAATQETVQFFYSPVKDVCEWGPSNTFKATDNTANGGVCAYVADKNRLYACPAPDSTCWSFNQSCKGGTATPGSDQILCGTSNGSQWCCADTETCTVTPGQINVCVSPFSSPNKGVSKESAVQAQYSDLPSASIGTSVPRATPSAFSTRRLGASSSTDSSSSRSSSGRSSSLSSSSTSSFPSTTSTSAPASSSSSISGGAIAGIVIGVIAGIGLLVAAVALLLLRRRKRTAAASAPFEAPADEIQPSPYHGAYKPAGESAYHDGAVYEKVADVPPQELPAPDPRQELP